MSNRNEALTPERKRENRVNALGQQLTGGAMLAGGAIGNEALDTRLRNRGAKPVGAALVARARRKPGGFTARTHVPHLAGRALTRGVQLASIPLLANGTKNLVTGDDTKRLHLRDDVAKPVVRYATYQDDPSLKKSLNEPEVARLDRHKKAGQYLSLASGGLGVAALGLRSPQAARALSRRGVKGLNGIARHEAKATNVSNTLGVGAIGLGSIGSFNYAAQQRLERKRDVVNKALLYRGMSVPGVKNALKNGFRAADRGDIGPGVYFTPDKAAAHDYALPGGNGRRASLKGLRGKRIGRVITFEDEGLKPIARGKGGPDFPTGNGGWSAYEQVTFHPKDVTRSRIKRIDNVNRTTQERLRVRIEEQPGGRLHGRLRPLDGPVVTPSVSERLAGLKERGGHDWKNQLRVEADEARRLARRMNQWGRFPSTYKDSGVGKSVRAERLASVSKSYVTQHPERVSPGAERWYRQARRDRNHYAASATGEAGLAGLSGWLLSHELRKKPVSKPAVGVTALTALASGYGALHAAGNARRRQKSMRVVEEKARARASQGLYGPGRGVSPVDSSSKSFRRYEGAK